MPTDILSEQEIYWIWSGQLEETACPDNLWMQMRKWLSYENFAKSIHLTNRIAISGQKIIDQTRASLDLDISRIYNISELGK